MQEDVVVTLCLLEKYFPPSFFTIMVALALEVPKNSITPSLRWIAHGPSPDVATYFGYIINGYYYHTKRRDDIRRIQNSGVSITATTMQVSSSKDKTPVMSDIMFYGVIQEIWEIDYHQLSFILFKFDWVDNRSGVKVDELGFTIMDLKRIGHKSDSFILATQAKKVFYVQDSANPEWLVVLTSPQRTIEEDFLKDEIGDMLQKCGYETIKRMPNVDTPNETDDTNSTYIRHDCEGRWIHRWRIAVMMKEKYFQKIIVVFKGKEGRNAYTITTCHKITYNVSYRSTLWKEARKRRNNDYFDDATRDCASQIDELVATHKNEDILTNALGSKEHGGNVRGVGRFVSQSQYFNTVKGKEKMITPQVKISHKEEDESRCKSDKKRSNHLRSSIGSINIDLDVDEDTPSKKGVEGTPRQLSIGSVNNIVAVAVIVEDNIGCPNVKVLVDVVTAENLTIPNPMKGKIETLNQALAREDLLHYCGMVEIGYMCILAYITCLWDEYDCARNFFVTDQSKISSHIKDRDLRSRNLANQLEAVNLEQKVLIPYNTGFHWMLHVIDLRENCVYVLDSLQSKVNEDIHGVINVHGKRNTIYNAIDQLQNGDL
ncbi:transposase [Cucumis melo var. makuwa]|uniref:Transposase n=1 Tax=Cucumis melo var. makuwa TaxID=1194695 RepID=A0A5D3CHN3_CUCMM|nr:transposase [Cucumis melo var. makuwa]